MQFFKTLSLLSTIAATVSALPQGLHPTITETITLSPISATAPATSTSSAATSTSTGTGIQIVNNLDETIYIWSTSNTASEMQTIASGDSYTESRTNSDGGISIKMATTTSEESVLQFEYTESEDTLWWDLSCINLDKDSSFISSGFGVTTDDSSCSSATCAAGDTDCADAYQQADDVDTYSCSSSAAFTMTLG
jgi:hypothetical protein